MLHSALAPSTRVHVTRLDRLLGEVWPQRVLEAGLGQARAHEALDGVVLRFDAVVVRVVGSTERAENGVGREVVLEDVVIVLTAAVGAQHPHGVRGVERTALSDEHPARGHPMARRVFVSHAELDLNAQTDNYRC